MPKGKKLQEVVLRGIPISKGIGIGPPLFFADMEEEILEIVISKKEIDLEINRYRQALEMSRKDVQELQLASKSEGFSEVVSILGTHLEMMKDPLLTSGIEKKIRDTRKNTESIFQGIIEEYKERFSSLKDQYFQERVRDIIDVSRRILGHLQPLKKSGFQNVAHQAIVLTHELVPSETVEANASLVNAFVTAVGGITSHAAIIARAKGIPYVTNIDLKQLSKVEVGSLIVDGSQGLVILNPSLKTLQKYQEIQKSHQQGYKMLKSASHLKGETIDGYEIQIFANLENPKEIHTVHQAGASGVGLFRSEYLFFSRKAIPQEEEQYLIYKKMLKSLKGDPLVVRVFDIGGDKKIDLPKGSPDAKYFEAIGTEINPALGCRAIRFLRLYPEILEVQLRAILRASAHGPVHILVPMISDLSEIRFVRQKVKQIQSELRKKEIKTAKKVLIGCMIEVPSAAILADEIVEEVDFISIGTNDLVQYVLAADRNNPKTADLYFSTHPSILRLIRMVVSSANRACIPVVLCGECATDPLLIPLFIGLGIREFSVATRHIPLLKHTIRKWRLLETSRLAEGALEYSSAKALQEFLKKEAAR